MIRKKSHSEAYDLEKSSVGVIVHAFEVDNIISSQ